MILWRCEKDGMASLANIASYAVQAFIKGALFPTPDYISYCYTHSCVRTLDAFRDRTQKRGLVIYSGYARSFIASRSREPTMAEGTMSRYFLKGLVARPRTKQPVYLSVLDGIEQPEHKTGVRWTSMAKRRGWRTVCLQHGGTKTSSMKDLIQSCASELATSTQSSTAFCTSNTEKPIIEIGYPFAEQLKQGKPGGYILIATCMHSEYEHNPRAYQQFISEIRQAIDRIHCQFVIAPHPIDKPDAYHVLLKHPRVKVKGPEQTVYNLLEKCNAVLTRASTVGEEGLLIGKPVVFHDAAGERVRTTYQALERDDLAFFSEGPDMLADCLTHALNTPQQPTRFIPPYNPDLIFRVTHS